MLNTVHNGVIIPADMVTATTAEKDAYAAKVKMGNRAFCDAALALEDEARRLGITL